VKYRKVGASGLQVSEVGFGLWTVSTNWWGVVELAQGIRLLQEARELGVTLFDTADTYGEGLGEEILARALGPHRHEIVIATKFGYDFYQPQVREGHRERPQDFNPAFVRYACEQSLRRLKTDYIDLYQLHNPRLEAVQRDDLFALLEELVREGKVRCYGAALGPDIGWFEEGDAAMKERPVASLQIIYSVLEQQPARRFFPTAAERGVGLLARVPHASEALTEEFRRTRTPPVFGAGDHRSHRKQEWLQQAVQKVEQLDFLTQHHPVPLDQLAITFGLAQPTVACILPNITSGDQLRAYAAASEAEQPCPECLQRLYDLYDANFSLKPVAG
jgi:aryl-alcohol dehydrogenase-like predicted oxidoreductase